MWSKVPDFEEVQSAYHKAGLLQAQIRLKNEELNIKAAPLKKENPRKPHVILEALQEEYTHIANLEAELAIVQSDIRFFEFWKEIYKSNAFANR